MSATVLVTGGSGFLGLHTIIQLLERGYRVRTTVRSLARETQVRETLEGAGVDPGERLSFFAADLLADDGWPAAADGAEFVLHVASPFPATAPAHEDDLIVPAREGTLRVLRAARDAGARRVVVTSSFAAVGYGREPGDHVFTEADWTDPTADIGAYIKSKAIAERAAWDFERGATWSSPSSTRSASSARCSAATTRPRSGWSPVCSAVRWRPGCRACRSRSSTSATPPTCTCAR